MTPGVRAVRGVSRAEALINKAEHDTRLRYAGSGPDMQAALIGALGSVIVDLCIALEDCATPKKDKYYVRFEHEQTCDDGTTIVVEIDYDADSAEVQHVWHRDLDVCMLLGEAPRWACDAAWAYEKRTHAGQQLGKRLLRDQDRQIDRMGHDAANDAAARSLITQHGGEVAA